jgi:hypothetical protein
MTDTRSSAQSRDEHRAAVHGTWANVAPAWGANAVVRILERLDDTARRRLRDTVRRAVSRFETDGALELPGLALVLTATR